MLRSLPPPRGFAATRTVPGTLTQRSALPEPSPEELAHSARLARAIRAEIASTGPLEFARFMELALYAPGLGYYSAGRTKFGADGDFVTAPELGDVFARCLARGSAPVIEAIGPAGTTVFELGGGSGALCVDLMLAWQAMGCAPGRYLLLEPSASLRQTQQGRVAGELPESLAARVQWIDKPLEENWRGIAIANEVVDALPTFRFVKKKGEVWSEHVAVDGYGHFAVVDRPAEPWLAGAVAHLERRLGRTLPDGYRSEVLPQLPAWIDAVIGTLQQGLALFIDYGYPRNAYYAPERSDGTLVCHYRHHAHADPLHWVGLQDLTAFVDFTALAEACLAIGLDLVSYSTQAQFLLACGLGQVMHQDERDDAEAQYAFSQQVKRLMLPGEMGERFAVAAFARDIDHASLPFAAIDRSSVL